MRREKCTTYGIINQWLLHINGRMYVMKDVWKTVYMEKERIRFLSHEQISIPDGLKN